MEEFTSTEIKDKREFNRAGYHYTRVSEDNINHIYVYRMDKIKDDTGCEPSYKSYEVVKGKKKGGKYIYPSSEDFGTYGWYICGDEKTCQEKIVKKIAVLSGGGFQEPL